MNDTVVFIMRNKRVDTTLNPTENDGSDTYEKDCEYENKEYFHDVLLFLYLIIRI